MSGESDAIDSEEVNQEDGVELVRCKRGHTVKRDGCDRYVGRLFCPLCECLIENVGVEGEVCEYSARVVCTEEAAPTIANAWMVFCNTVRDVDGAEIADARADPEGMERANGGQDDG